MERAFGHAVVTHTRWTREGSGSARSVMDCAPKVVNTATAPTIYSDGRDYGIHDDTA